MIIQYKNVDQNRLKGLPGYTVNHVHCSPAPSKFTVAYIPNIRLCEFVTPAIIRPQPKKIKKKLWHYLEAEVTFNVMVTRSHLCSFYPSARYQLHFIRF